MKMLQGSSNLCFTNQHKEMYRRKKFFGHFHHFCDHSTKHVHNKTGNVLIIQQWGAFVQLFLQWKSSKYKYCTFWLCVCSLRYPATKRMRRTILSSVACPVLQYFSTLSHERQDLKKKKFPNMQCVLCSTTWVSNISYAEKNRRRNDKEFNQSSGNVPVILGTFELNFSILDILSKWYSYFMKIRP